MEACSTDAECGEGFNCIVGKCYAAACVSEGTVCSNHGECVIDKCYCFHNFTGEHCETCREGFSNEGENICHKTCTNEAVCDLNQDCVNGVCVCKELTFDYNHKCLYCKEGLVMGHDADGKNLCVAAECLGNGNLVCNGRGTCNDAEKTCTCTDSEKFTGGACQTCKVDSRPATADGKCGIPEECIDTKYHLECGGHGNCVMESEEPLCACAPGYKPGPKHLCSVCDDHYIEINGKCVSIFCVDPENQSSECYNNGHCAESNLKCECDQGIATGRYCEECSEGYSARFDGKCVTNNCMVDGIECAGRGACLMGECDCDPQYTDSSKCVDCAPGFVSTGSECHHANCVIKVGEVNTVCSYHGHCELDSIGTVAKCVCEDGYTGGKCETCAEGFFQTHGFCESEACETSSVVCNQNGYCRKGEDDKYACACYETVASGEKCETCEDPYETINGKCEHPDCIESGVVCNNHGMCLNFNGINQCACDDNFNSADKCKTCLSGYILSGDKCVVNDIKCRQNEFDNILCAGHGECVNNFSCHCYKQYGGDFCEDCANEYYAEDKSGVCRLKCQENEDCPSALMLCDTDGEGESDVGFCICRNETFDYDQDCLRCPNGQAPVKGAGRNVVCVPEVCAFNDKECNGAGECGGNFGQPRCLCTNQLYTGTYCEECAEGAVSLGRNICAATGCVSSATPTEICSSHGTCIVSAPASGNGFTGKCECNNNFAGEFCEKCKAGMIEINDECMVGSCVGRNMKECNGNGECLEIEGKEEYECKCNKYSLQDSRACDTCNEEVAHLKDGVCYPLSCFNSEESYCSGRGECVTNWDGSMRCICNDLIHSSETACAGCKEGYTMIEGECVDNECLSADKKICSGHGFCKEISAIEDWYECECEEGYITADCSGCDTDKGFVSINGICAQPACITGETVKTVCHDNGRCVEKTPGDWYCVCETATGDFCEECKPELVPTTAGKCIQPHCFIDGTECNNHGRCISQEMAYFCLCDDKHLSIASKCVECEEGYTWRDGACYDLRTTCYNEDGILCSNNGTCHDGVCYCHLRYEGEYCNQCIEGAVEMDGECLRACSTDDDCGGVQVCNYGSCICKGEFLDIDNECLSCIPGRRFVIATSKCEPEECVTLHGELCNDDGECIFDENEGKWMCECSHPMVADGDKCELCGTYAIETMDGKCAPEGCYDGGYMCDNHGKCEQGEGELSFHCKCKPGYTGKYCNECDTGFVIDMFDDCVSVACTQRAESPCSGNGRCKLDDDSGKWACECFSGEGKWCEDCSEGYNKVGDKCIAIECISSDLKECGGYGQCLMIGMGARCMCDDHRDSATACTTCAHDYRDVEGMCVSNNCFTPLGRYCNRAGECRLFDEFTSLYVCECNTGYAGTACERCSAGWEQIGSLCVRPECKTGVNECNGNGICDNSTGEWVCSCNAATGVMCETCPAGSVKLDNGKCSPPSCAVNGKECNDLGVCIPLFDAVCICDSADLDAEAKCAACKDGKYLQDGVCVEEKPEDPSLMSPGAIAGIAIGAVVLVALIAVGVFFLIKKMRSQSTVSNVVSPKPDPSGQGDAQTYI